MELLKLVTSVLPEFYNILMIVLKLPLVHLIICRLKFVKKSPIIKNLIYGV